jgi:hypothetical protein
MRNTARNGPLAGGKEVKMDALSELLPRGLNVLKERLVSWFNEAAERRRLAQEFANLEGRDLDRVLADVGCSREDLTMIVRNAPRSRPLLDSMILRLGLEREFALAGPQLARDIERRCATCGAQARCSAWMRRGRVSDDHRQFCPNAGNFERLTEKAAV